MKIIHVGDIHIRAARRNEYQTVFDDLIDHVERISKTDKTVVAILGDVFDNKTSVKPEEIDLFSYLIRTLISIKIPVVIIPGNHDYNNNQPEKMDLISPLGEILEHELIRYFPKSGNYEFQDVCWRVYSPIDKKNPPAYDGKCQRVALVHETVQGCRLPNNTTWNDVTRLNALELEKQNDLVLLGDIHRPQFITPRVAYCGSLIQQNMGEHPKDHGFIEWTFDKTWSSAYHRIANPYGSYLKIVLRDNTLVTDLKVDKVQKCLVEYTNCDAKFVDGTVELITRTFGVKPYKVLDMTQYALSVQDVKDVKQDIVHDRESHASVLKEWLVKAKVPDVDKIVQRHIKMMHDQQAKDENYAALSFQLCYLEWKGMLKYDDKTLQWINFDTIKSSHIGISGRNKSGKSSILDIISFILYNEPLRGSVKDIVNRNSKGYQCRVIISANGKKYEISRKGDTSRNSTIKICEDGKNVTPSTIPESYVMLGKIVGRHDDFMNITCQTQDSLPFTAKSQPEQTRYVYNILGMDHIPEIEKEVKAQIREQKAIQKTVIAPSRQAPAPDAKRKETVDTLLAEKDFLGKELSVVDEKIGVQHRLVGMTNTEDIDTEIKSLEQKLAGVSMPDEPVEKLSEDMRKLEAEKIKIEHLVKPKISREEAMSYVYREIVIPDAVDPVELRLAHDTLAHTRANYRVKCDALSAVTIVQVEDPKVDDIALRNERLELEAKRNAATVIAELENQLSELEFKFDDTCSCCVNNKRQLSVLKKDDVKHDAFNNDRYEVVCRLLFQHAAWQRYCAATALREQISCLKNLVDEQSDRLDKLVDAESKRAKIVRDADYQALVMSAKEYYIRHDKIVKYETAIRFVADKIRTIELSKRLVTVKMLRNEHQKLVDLNARKVIMTKRIVEVTDLLSKLTDELKLVAEWESYHARVADSKSELQLLEHYKKALCPKAGFPSLLVDRAALRIAAYTNKFISTIGDDTISIDSSTFAISISGLPAALASGFQKMLVGLSLRLAFMRECARPLLHNTLIIDEGLLSACDPENLHSLLTCLRGQSSRLIVVSHLVDVQSMFTSIISADQHIRIGEQNVTVEIVAPRKTIRRGDIISGMTCTVCGVTCRGAGFLRRHIMSDIHRSTLATYDILP